LERLPVPLSCLRNPNHGPSLGIGRAVVRRLVDLGAKVVAVGQTQTKLDSLKEEVGERVETICVDLGDWKETRSKLGDICRKVDLLVNNAAYSSNSPVDEVTEEELSRIIDVNLKAPLNLIGLVAKGMKERRYGSIVNVSSVAAIAALDEHVSYAASKAALDMITRVSAKELGPFDIRVNSVNPTVVWTRMGSEFWGKDEKRKSLMISKIPMGRFVEVKEAVDPIIYLLSGNSSMISGVVLPVDGGFIAT